MIKFGVILFALVFSQFPSSAQEVENKTDSITKIISITPYLELDQNTASQFAVQIKEPSTIQLSSGINVINSLRGRVPNLSIPSYAAGVKAGIRGFNYNASIILDGIPFYNTLPNFVSLNGFDYSSISAISNTNSLIALDGLEDGVIILQSKTGKGFTKPSFELNSYTTYGYNNVTYLDYLTGTVSKNRQQDWLLSNAIAYMQDFGKADTRISYTLNSKNSQFVSTIGSPVNHSIKLNTGIQVSKKLSVRILLDNSSTSDDYTVASWNSNDPQNVTTKQNFLNGNLSLLYTLNSYLRLSSQLNLTSVYNKNYLKSDQFFETQSKNNSRYFGNFFLNFVKKINQLTVSANTGIQYTNQINTAELKSNTINSEYESRINSPNIVVGSELGFKDIVFANGQYRVSEYSSLPASGNRKFNYSTGLSFVFSKLIQSEMLSLGRIRVTSGKTNPWALNNFPSFISSGTSLKPESKVSSEVGLDLNFFNSRVNLSTNYFINRTENKTTFGGSSNSSGFITTYANIGNLTHSGIEFSIGCKPIVSKKINYEMMLIYSTLNAVVALRGAGNGNPPPSGLLSSPYPNWRGSFYNQIEGKKLGLSFLVDAIQGGQYFIFNPANNPRSVDGSFVKLRDISVRYQFADLLINKLNLSKVWFSVSFRNSIIYTVDDFDPEATNSPLQKSISGNLYFSF